MYQIIKEESSLFGVLVKRTCVAIVKFDDIVRYMSGLSYSKAKYYVVKE